MLKDYITTDPGEEAHSISGRRRATERKDCSILLEVNKRGTYYWKSQCVTNDAGGNSGRGGTGREGSPEVGTECALPHQSNGTCHNAGLVAQDSVSWVRTSCRL